MSRRGDAPPRGIQRGEAHQPAAFWVGLALGWLLIGIGVWFAIEEVGDAFGAFLVALGAFALVHDGLVLPAALLVSVTVERLAPAPARVPVRLGIALSWVLTLISLPALGRFGAIADNPSVLPVNVGRNLAILVGLIWLGVVAVSVHRMRSTRTENRAT
ncbi:MAG: hypothetical protein R2754_01340 [Microthrixaceae bacterium]